MTHWLLREDRERILNLFSDYESDNEKYISRTLAKRLFGAAALQYAENCGELGCEMNFMNIGDGLLGEKVFSEYGVELLFEYYRIEQVRKGKSRTMDGNRKWEQWFKKGCLEEFINKNMYLSRDFPRCGTSRQRVLAAVPESLRGREPLPFKLP